jgi:hypothetical protein
VLSSPLQGGRVLELIPEGRGWRLAVTQVDGEHRRQVGGFDLATAELPVVAATLQAIATYTATRRAA